MAESESQQFFQTINFDRRPFICHWRTHLAIVAWKVDFQAYAAYQGLSEEDRALDSEGGLTMLGSHTDACLRLLEQECDC